MIKVSKFKEGSYWSDAVAHQYEPQYTNQEIVIASGSNDEEKTLPTLFVLGLESNGKYKPFVSQDKVALLYTEVDASLTDVKATAMVRGPATVDFSKCFFAEGTTEVQKQAAITKFLAQGIKGV